MLPGRPTKYDPAFCEMLIGHMADGFSFTAACGLIGICKQTGYNWAEEHPEFLDAKRLGMTLRVVRLERDLLAAETGPMTTSRIFALKNADPEEWRDRQETALTGANGGPIQVEDVSARERIAERLARLEAAERD